MVQCNIGTMQQWLLQCLAIGAVAARFYACLLPIDTVHMQFGACQKCKS